MVQRKRKDTRRRKGRSKKGKKWFVLWLVGSVAVGLLALIALYPHTPRKAPKTVRPAYEEIYSSKGDLRLLIRKTDKVLYNALYHSGIRERDILFLEVQPRHHNGRVWEFTELLVRHLNGHRAEDIIRAMGKGLEKLGPDAALERVRGPAQEILCHIRLQGYQTHRITFTLDRAPDEEKPSKPKLAIIIDDLGYDLSVGRGLLELDDALSFSVLPSAPFTGRIVKAARERRRELMLHLPLEPKNFPTVHPGPGALLIAMEDQTLRNMLERDLKQVSGAIGVNNHMGSCFTENHEKMALVLGEIKKKDLFYVDSRTSSGTLGYELGRKMGIAVGKRGVFFDNDLDPKAIGFQFERALSMARQTGTAIGIGHPHEETLAALKEFLPKIREEFRLVRASQVVD